MASREIPGLESQLHHTFNNLMIPKLNLLNFSFFIFKVITKSSCKGLQRYIKCIVWCVEASQGLNKMCYPKWPHRIKMNLRIKLCANSLIYEVSVNCEQLEAVLSAERWMVLLLSQPTARIEMYSSSLPFSFEISTKWVKSDPGIGKIKARQAFI